MLLIQLHDLRPLDGAVVQVEEGEGVVALGPLLGGAAGVEQALAVTPDVERCVAVPEDDEVAGGEPASQAGLSAGARAAVVDHADPHAAEHDFAPLGEVEVDVVVAEDVGLEAS